ACERPFDAENCCKNIVKFKPAHSNAWHVLGTVYQYQGNLNKAINCYSKATHIQPDLSESYYFSANAQRELGDLNKAVSLYEKAIKYKESYLEALANLGATLLELNRYDESLSVLIDAFKLKPDAVQILCSLAAVMLAFRRPDDALLYILKAEKIDSSFYDVQRLLGSIYKELGRYDKSIESYQILLSINVNDELAIAAMASIFERQGRYMDAFDLIKSPLDLNTVNKSILVTFSKLYGKIDRDNNSIQLIEAVLQNENTLSDEVIDLHYELGRRYDKNAEYDLAFKHYKLANDKTRAQYSDVTEKNRMKNHTSMLPKWLPDDQSGFFDQISSSSNVSQQPVFVVGMLRSGTTLTEQILSSHPDIQAGSELIGLQFINPVLKYDAQSEPDYYQTHKNIDTGVLNTIADSYLNKVNTLADKTPRIIDGIRTQLDYFTIIARVFPNAHVIYTSREPLDNCLSIYFQNLGATPTLAYTSDLQEIGKSYIHQMNLMAYYKKVLDINILEIKYEDLATNLEETSKKMIEFCGLDWDERCLNFHKTKRDVITPSYDQVRQPIYTKSIQRWKHYNEHLNELKNVLSEV
ncbi:MAG: sulfotransferase, partial [Methylococcales bacterium]